MRMAEEERRVVGSGVHLRLKKKEDRARGIRERAGGGEALRKPGFARALALDFAAG
jgi:hypothetical protein